MRPPVIHLISRSDLQGITIPPSEIISLVEEAFLVFANGDSICPVKLMMAPPHSQRDTLSFSMLGYDGTLQQLGFKTHFRQGNTDRSEKYYPTISLYDDITGLPFAMMDCLFVGASRTPAVTAVIAKYCAVPHAADVLMIGTGAENTNTLPYLATALPHLKKFRLFGTHPDGIAATLKRFNEHFPGREIEIVADVESAVAASDIVVVASGRAAHPKIRTSWMRPGGLMISVSSKGVDAGALIEADYSLATSKGQLMVTGTRLIDSNGAASIDAELPDVIAGREPGRRSIKDRVFVFSSGMIIADIPVAHAFATRAIAAGRGTKVALWS